MPPHKKPKTLENVSLHAVATLVSNACDNIEKKYGNVDEEICRCKLKILQGYVLSKIQPLFDELCRVVLEQQTSQKHPARDIRCALRFILCEQTKTFELQRIIQSNSVKSLNEGPFFTNQFSKLRNIIKLDIVQITLTDEMFNEIFRVCKNLCDIAVKSDLEFSSKDSVYKLLQCEKLQNVQIYFVGWNDKREIICCIQKFVQHLRNLRHFQFDEMGTVLLLLDEKTATSLCKLREKCININSLRNIIELCPNLRDLNIDAHFSTEREKDNMLEILAESSLTLKILQLHRFPFSQQMTNLLKLKGNNLLKLTLCTNAGSLTYNDVYTVGVYCPKLETLEIMEMFSIFSLIKVSGVLKIPIQTRMFVNLKYLVIKADSKWDQRILPLILSHANNLEKMSLTNVFAKKVGGNASSFLDMLNANPLKLLNSFSLVSERYGNDEGAMPTFDKRSIQNVVDSCTKLTSLELDCVFDDGAIRYLEELERKIVDENLDLRLFYKCGKYSLDACDVSAPGGYVLHYEY